MEPKKKFYENQAGTIIKAMKKRQFEGWYAPDAAAARELALSMVRENSTVSFGGSMTLAETGILDSLREMPIRLLDRSKAESPEEVGRIYRAAFSADTYFTGTNAITLDGELVNIDGSGNRVAALTFGPAQVIVIAGMNKVAANVEDAINRIKHMASPPNTVRLGKQTPCAATGKCHDCYVDDCICSSTVVTRRTGIPGRIKVILVGEPLGY